MKILGAVTMIGQIKPSLGMGWYFLGNDGAGVGTQNQMHLMPQGFQGFQRAQAVDGAAGTSDGQDDPFFIFHDGIILWNVPGLSLSTFQEVL